MIGYFDSCALVKRYIREQGTSDVQRLLDETTPTTARLSVVEIVSAMSRRCREGDIDEPERDRLVRALKEDVERIYTVELTKRLSDRAGELLQRHALRAGDAIQLASCLHLQNRTGAPVQFVSYDARLLEAARAEGIAIPAFLR